MELAWDPFQGSEVRLAGPVSFQLAGPSLVWTRVMARPAELRERRRDGMPRHAIVHTSYLGSSVRSRGGPNRQWRSSTFAPTCGALAGLAPQPGSRLWCRSGSRKPTRHAPCSLPSMPLNLRVTLGPCCQLNACLACPGRWQGSPSGLVRCACWCHDSQALGLWRAAQRHPLGRQAGDAPGHPQGKLLIRKQGQARTTGERQA